jgi:hypothetical protein
MKRFLMVVVPMLLSVGSARAACTDPAAVAATRSAADLQCPCAAAIGHKPYVQCVARVAKAAAKSRSLPKQCKAAVVACAKNSTCGGELRRRDDDHHDARRPDDHDHGRCADAHRHGRPG